MSRALLVLNIVIVCLLILVSAALYFKQEKIAFINTSEIYDDFQLKKDLELKLKNITQSRKSIADSLKLNLQMFANSLDKKNVEAVNKFNLMREQYLQKEKQFEEDNHSLAQTYTEQIWKQLNEYIKDFGKTKKYKYIFGVNGEGTLMYADEAENITNELRQYVKDRFNGK
jgi:outer membrane protein